MKKIILTTTIIITLLFNASVLTSAEEIQASQEGIQVEQTTQVPEAQETARVEQTNQVDAAQQNIGTTDAIPDIKTDSPLYFLRSVFENVQLFLTFDETEKMQLLEEIATERLEDLKGLDSEKQKELAEKITKVYEKSIEKLTYIAEKRKAEGKEVLDAAAILEKAAIKASNVELKEEIKDELDETTQKAQITAAVVRDIDPEVVKGLREQGFGYGKIAIVVGLAEKSGKSIDEVVKMLQENKGIGKTAKSLGVKPGDFKYHKQNINQLNNDDREETDNSIIKEDKKDKKEYRIGMDGKKADKQKHGKSGNAKKNK